MQVHLERDAAAGAVVRPALLDRNGMNGTEQNGVGRSGTEWNGTGTERNRWSVWRHARLAWSPSKCAAGVVVISRLYGPRQILSSSRSAAAAWVKPPTPARPPHAAHSSPPASRRSLLPPRARGGRSGGETVARARDRRRAGGKRASYSGGRCRVAVVVGSLSLSRAFARSLPRSERRTRRTPRRTPLVDGRRRPPAAVATMEHSRDVTCTPATRPSREIVPRRDARLRDVSLA